MELGRIPEPGYLGSSGHWDMMRPQKGSNSGDLSSGSSLYQLNSKPTGNPQNWDFLLGECVDGIQLLHPSNMSCVQNSVTPSGGV